MRLGDRSIVEEIARPIVDHAVELFLAPVDALKHGRRGQELERAAHREAFTGAMRKPCAAAGVEDRHAEPAPLARLDRRETFVCELHAILAWGRRGASKAGGCGRRESNNEGT